MSHFIKSVDRELDLLKQRLFICIGTQRAGTSWLHKTLLNHPDVHVTQSKEIDFWNTRLYPEMNEKYRRRAMLRNLRKN